jgi:hypothetical protein
MGRIIKPRVRISALAGPGNMVLILGIGSVSQLGPLVLGQLKKAAAESTR